MNTDNNKPSNTTVATPSAPQPADATKRKTGGRQKGSINKVTAQTKAVISSLISDYQDSGLMNADFMALEPKDRMAVAERLMQYVVPKMQSTSIELESKADTRITIEQRLRDLSVPKDPDK